jgi:DNA-binding LacI/PurR family transcriptional regulator
VSLRDVAAHAGVSPATVSRALNGNPRVDSGLRERVQASVKTLGYRPNMLARNLRRQRVNTIGVVVSDIVNPHFSEMVREIEREGFRAGYRVLVCATNESADKQADYLRALADERVAGVVLSPTNPSGQEIAELIDAGIPVVAFDRAVSDERVDTVMADNVGGVVQATQLLVGNGHQRIAYVGGGKDVASSKDRLTGYKRAMRAAGLSPRTAVGHFSMDGGRQAMSALLASSPAPTAAVVANNLMTLGAVQAAHVAGVQIPQDLAVVGIDDPYWAEFVAPPITSVAQPVAAMAREAIGMLLTRLTRDAGPPHRSVHSMHLIVRESSGAPRPHSRTARRGS